MKEEARTNGHGLLTSDVPERTHDAGRFTDVLTRVIAALETLAVGDVLEVEAILADLEADLRRAVGGTDE
jgi:hypothetical protein